MSDHDDQGIGAEIKYQTVSELRPSQYHVNLRVKVLSTQMLAELYDYNTWSNTKVAEILVGDETGTVLVKAMNDRIEELPLNATVIILDARTIIYRGHLRVILEEGKGVGGDSVCRSQVMVRDEPESLNQVDLERNVSLAEWQYVPGVVHTSARAPPPFDDG